MPLNILEYVEVSLNQKLQVPSQYVKLIYDSEILLLYPSSDPCISEPFTVMFKPGTYIFKLFGATGGGDAGGEGGSTKGTITFKSAKTLYFYIGSKGTQNSCIVSGGGGKGSTYSYSGGGSTDVRTQKDQDPYNMTSLRSRIMVAGGGGGGNLYETSKNVKGGCGGGIEGGDSEMGPKGTVQANLTIGATQTRGGIAIQQDTESTEVGNNGEFGKGGNSKQRSFYTSGGGGGYYGGASSNDGKASVSSGSGGSSFISGMKGCNAVDENGIHKGNAFHYSGLYFTNAETKSCVSAYDGYAIIQIISPVTCTYFSIDFVFRLDIFILIMILKA